jgi:hypothetical protein
MALSQLPVATFVHSGNARRNSNDTGPLKLHDLGMLFEFDIQFSCQGHRNSSTQSLERADTGE